MFNIIGKCISKIGANVFDAFWEKAAYEWCFLNPIGKLGFKLECFGNRLQGLRLYSRKN